MANTPTNPQKTFGDVAPALADYSEKVLFGDLWERPNLSPRDRSLVTNYGSDRSLPPQRAAVSSEARDRERRHRGRNCRNDHASRLLRRMAGRQHGRADRAQGVRRDRQMSPSGEFA
jgi:hypothetical protein